MGNPIVVDAHADGKGTGDTGNTAPCDWCASLEDGSAAAAPIADPCNKDSPVGLDTSL